MTVGKYGNMNIPYYSQHNDVTREEWKNRACGVTCVKMILDSFGQAQDITIDQLIDEGIFVGGYNEKVGWNHEGLVRLLHNHGVAGYKEEFRSVFIDLVSKVAQNNSFEKKLIAHGLEKISQEASQGNPVILSIDGSLWDAKETHLIVCTGYDFETDEYIYHDPNSSYEPHQDARISKEKLEKYWRRFAIFAHPVEA